ncbi:MAG: hypothetical protein H2067_02780 [Alcanivorax sp.]|nr:hypothetical protein [Alcanivorax sp.]
MVLAELLDQGFPEQSLLPLTMSDLTVELETSLRWLPGRRLTALARWNGTPVVVKAYAASSRGREEFQREQRAFDQLHRRGVAAPVRLACAETHEGALLLLEYLEGDTAAQYLAALTSRAERRALITDLAGWVAIQHGRGVLQTDIHLGNFLLHKGEWCLLDADSCRFGAVRYNVAKENLARLLAQFDPLDVPDLDTLRDTLPIAPGRGRLHRAQERRYRDMLGKTQRECTEFVPVNTAGLRGMARRDAWPVLARFLEGGVDGLNKIMANGRMLKDGGSATVVALPENGWVLKRYNLKNAAHKFRRQFGRTRAKNAWLAGHFLRFIGVDTPQPIAFLEESSGGLVGRCWLICTGETGAGLDSVRADDILPEYQARALGEFFHLMADFSFAHGDMKASNILLTKDGISIIDLDAFRRFRLPVLARRAREKDRKRLLRNWSEETPLRAQIARLIREENR